ncbi:hypothetical protein M404DRAFT_1007040 [Pisolithus tinctorius Marx 270]|uniref:Uncharacterized protein n=1 Tax=Pisolithus tinctorius Marx 270 TaxID=870435 RepID=A0A0C3IGC2_PISTI|nr:hypothetical protein M404DRAFT_1007040 [Pisolithus tinctorius Marx 270]
MGSLPKIWFFYHNNTQLKCTFIPNDEQVQSASCLEELSVSIAARLSTLLARSITPSSINFWKLREPRPRTILPPSVRLEDIAEMVLDTGESADSYISLDENFVKLAIEWTSPAPKGEKRTHAEDNIVDAVKRAKITQVSPSQLADPKYYRSLNKDPEECVIEHRRVYNSKEPLDRELSHFMDDFPPISLQYEGFGCFLDIFRGYKGVLGTENVSSQKLRSAVDKFAEFMSLVYEDEQARMEEGLLALNRIFSARTDGLSFTLMATNIDKNSHSGACILGPHGAGYCITEFKNEASVSAIPRIEMVGYFAQTIKTAVENGLSPSVMSGWGLPCLGLTIIGYTVTFYAMIFLGRWRVVNLTPGLSCLWASGDGDDRIALYNAFTAASVLLARISQEAMQVIDNPPPAIEESRRKLPPITSLRNPDSGSQIEFKIVDFFYDRAPDRHLYVAETTEGQQILVKFTRRYSYELHKFCADRKHAPTLLGFQRLPGGYFGIAMEYLKTATPISLLRHVEKHSEWAKELWELVNSFHAENLVHGDLRWLNIVVCDGNRAMLVDFDFGGKQGEVFYPEGPLSIDLTAGRHSTDLKITKDDDIRVLTNTLTCVRTR